MPFLKASKEKVQFAGTKININEPEGYSEHPYILNQTNTNQAVIGGISNMYSPYILAYLISSDLEKKTLIRTIATLYFCGSILIFPIWIYNGLSNINDLICRSLLLIPAILGQKIGERVQDKISNETFKCDYH